MQALDMSTAVRYLSESEAALQILGAAYIQHQCYHSSSAKNQVLVVFKPVTLFNRLHQKHLFLCLCACNRTNGLSLTQVRALQGIPALVELFSSDNRSVQRYATGATRNLIYENAENKVTLVDAGGVVRLVSILSEPDEELRKTITGNDSFLSGRFQSHHPASVKHK